MSWSSWLAARLSLPLLRTLPAFVLILALFTGMPMDTQEGLPGCVPFMPLWTQLAQHVLGLIIGRYGYLPDTLL
jgi:hypothetical protein